VGVTIARDIGCSFSKVGWRVISHTLLQLAESE